MPFAGIAGEIVLGFDPVAGQVVVADLRRNLHRTCAVGEEAERLDGVRAEPGDDGRREHGGSPGFVPSVSADDLGHRAAYPSHFLVGEDGSELAIKRGYRPARTLDGYYVLLTIGLVHR